MKPKLESVKKELKKLILHTPFAKTLREQIYKLNAKSVVSGILF